MYLCLLPPRFYPENALVRYVQQIPHKQISCNSCLHFPICCLLAQMVKIGNAGDLGSTLGLGRCPGGGHGNLFQYSCLENPQGQRTLAGYSPWYRKESDII